MQLSSSRILLSLSLLLAVGCGSQTPSPASNQDRSTRPVSSDTQSGTPTPDSEREAHLKQVNQPASTSKSIELVEVNWNELQSLVSEKKGKIVIVDIWSTACEPCMKEFPHLISLQQRLKDDVVAISFDIDYAGIKNKPVTYYRERVVEFLGSQQDNEVLHRMCTTAADDLFTELNLDSIPAIYVYGRDGALAKRFDGANSEGSGVSYEKQVIPLVEELMKR